MDPQLIGVHNMVDNKARMYLYAERVAAKGTNQAISLSQTEFKQIFKFLKLYLALIATLPVYLSLLPPSIHFLATVVYKRKADTL